MNTTLERPRIRYALGLLIGLLGAAVAWGSAPYFRNTIFMVPTVITVLAILVAGGFWPAMLGALLTWVGAVSFQITSGAGLQPVEQGKMVLALLCIIGGCLIDSRARRERTRLADRERELVESEARYRMLLARASQERDLLDTILDTAGAGVVAVEFPSRKVLFVNQVFAQRWGVSRELLLEKGRDALKLEYAHPDGHALAPDYTPARHVAGTGTTMRGERLLIRRPGQEWKLISINATPVWDASGTICMVVQSSLDLTRHVATETALSSSEERLRRLTDAVPGCVFQYRHDPDGRYTPTFISGGMRELLDLPPNAPFPGAQDFPSFLLPDDRDRLRLVIEESARTRVRWTQEFQIVLPDGRRKWLRAISTPEPPLPDESVFWHGILLDVTERRQLEDDLLQVQKMESIGRLAGGIAHDFNNILTAIRGNVDLLLDEVTDDHPQVHELRDIRDAAERAAALTRQLLAFSRKQAIQARHLDLGELVREVEKMLRRVIGEDVVLLTQPSDEPGMVRADAGQLEQVLLNLAVNARDAMPEGGLLTIETRNIHLDVTSAAHLGLAQGDYVSLVVRDTGHGMDAETRKRIFDPFFTTKPAGKGTGLGLAMVYGIVRQSGGAISVDSEVGRGATFRLYFPRSARAERRATDRSTPVSLEAMRVPEGTTVLLVEDDPAVRSLARRMLADAGFTVLEASDAYEAMTLAGPSCRGIDAVVSDVIMPGIGGRDLVRELRSRRDDLLVLYMSGYLDIDAQRLELDGRTRLLSKPFTRDALLRNLGALIDRTVAA